MKRSTLKFLGALTVLVVLLLGCARTPEGEIVIPLIPPEYQDAFNTASYHTSYFITLRAFEGNCPFVLNFAPAFRAFSEALEKDVFVITAIDVYEMIMHAFDGTSKALTQLEADCIREKTSNHLK